MPSAHPTRRQVIAAGGVSVSALIGGCTDLLGRRDERSATTLRLSLSAMDGPLRERYVEDLEATRPPWDEEAFAAALNGTAYTTRHHTPFLARGDDEPTYALHDDTYYHLDSVVVGEETVTRPLLRLYEVGRVDSLSDPPEYVSKSSLPQPDKQAVQTAYFAARARENVGGVPWGLVERDGYVYRDDEAVAVSSLLADDGPAHVEVRDTVYEVSVTRERFHEAIYRPDVDPVAGSPAEMESILRAALLQSRLSRDDLSDQERTILRDAMGDGYSEQFPFSDPYEALLRKLDHWAYLDGNIEKDAIEDDTAHVLLYNDRYYEYLLTLGSR